MTVKREEVYEKMEGQPHIYIKKTKEVSISYTLQQMRVGFPVEFSREHIDISSMRAVASRLEKRGLKFSITNPKEDNWQTAYVVRVQ